MKRFFRISLCMALSLLWLASCEPEVTPDDPPEEEQPAPDPEPDPEPEPEPDPEPALSLHFTGLLEDLYPGETTSAACEIISEGTDASSSGSVADAPGIVYSSSDPSVATVSDNGTVLARKAGSTVITATIDGTEVSVQRKYYVTNLGILKQSYSRELIYFYGHTIYYKSVMQSWDFFDDWFYVCQVCGKPHTLTYTRKPVMEQAPQAYMHLKYFGHGDNMFVERTADGDYIWTSNYGTLEAGETNRYAGSQVLSRVWFESGKTIEPQQTTDNYVLPGMNRIIAAWDKENGNVGIWCRDSSGQAWFYVFPMDAMKELPVESIQLSFSRTYGSPQMTDRPTVRARNLYKLMPVCKFKMPFNNAPQGYDYHHNKIYLMRGAGVEPEDLAAGTGKNWARIYLISPNTAKTLVQVDVPWVQNVDLLNSEGFTDGCYFEPEGIKLKDGYVYIGFASRDAGSSPERRVNLFRYKRL